MIRQLTQQDHDIVQSYLDKDPLHNIHMIHGLQTHGLESERVTFWGAFKDDRLAGVLFAYNGSDSRYGCLAGDSPEILVQLGKLALASQIDKMLGKSTYIRPAIEKLRSQVATYVRSYHFYQIHPAQLIDHYDHSLTRAATEDDIPLLVELYKNYELRSPNRTIEHIEDEIRSVMKKSGHYFFIEAGGRAVSAASITPETDRAGMIESARTLPEFRGQGLYPSVRAACLEHLFKRGKIGVGLFRETNASMHRILEKQGGTITAKWLIVHFGKKIPLRRRILPPRIRRWAMRIKNRAMGHRWNTR